jgi:hypothetical protein
MKKLILSVVIVIMAFSIIGTPSANADVCRIPGIKEEGTGVVYCLGMGQSICIVPCGGDGGGRPLPQT